jgi:hypothetical protein
MTTKNGKFRGTLQILLRFWYIKLMLREASVIHVKVGPWIEGMEQNRKPSDGSNGSAQTFYFTTKGLIVWQLKGNYPRPGPKPKSDPARTTLRARSPTGKLEYFFNSPLGTRLLTAGQRHLLSWAVESFKYSYVIASLRVSDSGLLEACTYFIPSIPFV